ncbi:PaaI family thioesterase [Endozoicomonadaceae bacterium StTr2]
MTDLSSIPKLQAFVDQAFPDSTLIIEQAGDGTARIRFPVEERHLRPGGTVSGPVLFSIADCALYIAILATSPEDIMAVTSNLNINFLSRPIADKAIIGECRLIKNGRRLVYGEVVLFSEGDETPVAHATGTYAVPVKQQAS